MIYVDDNRLGLAELFTGVGVEIGVAEGWYSSKIMKLGKVSKMYGIDPYRAHRGYIDYTRNKTFERLRNRAHERLEKYHNYEFLEEFSLDAAKRFESNSLDFVYIDGDHSYEAVIQDINAWFPKLKIGGIMAGDDYIRSTRDKRYYDVMRAVNEFVEAKKLNLYLYGAGRTPTNWMVKK